MKILSINTKLTKDLSNVAFNVDSPIDKTIISKLKYPDLSVSIKELCIFLSGSGATSSIKKSDVEAVISKYNSVKKSVDSEIDIKDKAHAKLIESISANLDIPVGK